MQTGVAAQSAATTHSRCREDEASAQPLTGPIGGPSGGNARSAKDDIPQGVGGGGIHQKHQPPNHNTAAIKYQLEGRQQEQQRPQVGQGCPGTGNPPI
eukprot:6884824-Ditylum_brightwellii.AAC.1